MLFVAFVALALVSCSSSGDVGRTTIEAYDSAGVSIVMTRIGEDVPACEVSAEVMRIGAVDERQGVALHLVESAAVLRDGRIAITNRGTSQVMVFSPDGDLVTAFGRRGPGPGEFRNLWSVHVRGDDTLVVGDYRPWRFSFFTTDGEWLGQVELKPMVIERPDFAIPLASSTGFVMENPSFEVQDAMVDRIAPLWRYGADGERTGIVGEFWLDRFGFLAKDIGYVGNPIFGARASFAHLRDDWILYAAGREEQLEIWSVAGELVGIVRWEGPARPVRPGDADEWRRQRRETIEARVAITPAMQPVIDAQIGDHLPVADMYPAHDQVIVSREGGIWVEEYRRPHDEGPANWWVFDPDRRLRCSAALPSSVRVLAVSDRRVFGLGRDSLDVERIYGYDVTYPSDNRL